MAIPAEKPVKIDREDRKSTILPSLFDMQPPARTWAPESTPRIYIVHDEAEQLLQEGFGCLHPYFQTEGSKGSDGWFIDSDNGCVFEIEIKRLVHKSGERPLAIPRTATAPKGLTFIGKRPLSSQGFGAIEAALNKIRATVALDKVRAETEAAQAIAQTDAPAENADRAIRLLLSVHRSGRLDDAVDLLTLLGGELVREIVKSRQSTDPPNQSNEDYWYAVIRAAARTGDREIPRGFLGSQSIALQEAAVQGLGDIGDPAAIEDLRQVASDPTRPQLIRELADELVSDLA